MRLKCFILTGFVICTQCYSQQKATTLRAIQNNHIDSISIIWRTSCARPVCEATDPALARSLIYVNSVKSQLTQRGGVVDPDFLRIAHQESVHAAGLDGQAKTGTPESQVITDFLQRSKGNGVVFVNMTINEFDGTSFLASGALVRPLSGGGAGIFLSVELFAKSSGEKLWAASGRGSGLNPLDACLSDKCVVSLFRTFPDSLQ